MSGKVKEYPLEVESVSEFEGSDLLEFRSKGHHEPEEFLKAVREYNEDASQLWHEKYGPFDFEPSHVRHVYQRNIGVPGMKGAHTIHEANGPGRGAYPVTLVYC